MNPNRITIPAALIVAIALAFSRPSLAREQMAPATSPPTVAIFTAPAPGLSLAALSGKTYDEVVGAFNRLGRIIPVERNRITWALSKTAGEGADVYERAARLLDADMYAVLSFSERMRTVYGSMDIKALNPEYAGMQRPVKVRSKIALNVPLKLAREVALLHRDAALRFSVIREYRPGVALISAGQWHGLEPGNIATDRGTVRIVNVSHHESLAQLPTPSSPGVVFSTSLRPGVRQYAAELNDHITRNAIGSYGLSAALIRDGDEEGRFIRSLLLINPGGNLLLPAYGAYLSTGYLGLQATADGTGLALSAAAFTTHLLLPSLMTGMKCNFFPWNQDSDKPDSVRRLHVLLWVTIPLNYSVAYLDQLASILDRTSHLPPFFYHRDCAAATLSLFVPGGGLFYKGRRVEGWCYYVGEMALAGYGAHQWERGDRGRYAIAALGALKLVEIAHAFFAEASYRAFRREIDRETESARLDTGLFRTVEGESVFSVSLLRRF